MDALCAVAGRHGIMLIEDACQAFGGSYHGRRLGSIGTAGAFSFNIYKTITCGDGGMLVADAQDVYERCFALHDQGHLPLRRGVEIGQRAYLGLNLRMNEVSAAVLNVQLGRLEQILTTLRSNKAALRAAIETAPGVDFRRLTDPDGDVATHLVVTFADAATAAAVAADLGTKTLANSGWHFYANMEHLRRRRIVSGFARSVADYVADPGALPSTDALLPRSITLGIGVVDPGLGSAFGLDIRSSPTDIDQVAARFCAAVERHAG
jgi:dTDP-4-amino-4,6-dideoxygalactose transaminase